MRVVGDEWTSNDIVMITEDIPQFESDFHRDYFDQFRETIKYAKPLEIQQGHFQKQITITLHIEAYFKYTFISFYIPSLPNNTDVCAALLSEIPRFISSAAHVELAEHVGETKGANINISSIPFTNEVFVYSESDIDSASIKNIFTQYKITVYAN
jgi:hypothetical protein